MRQWLSYLVFEHCEHIEMSSYLEPMHIPTNLPVYLEALAQTLLYDASH